MSGLNKAVKWLKELFGSPYASSYVKEELNFGTPPKGGSSVQRPDRIEPLVRALTVDYGRTNKRLEYLHHLTVLHGKITKLNDGHRNMTERIHTVLDSIEKDLGLDGLNPDLVIADELHDVGNLNIKLDVDTSLMLESFKRVQEKFAAAIKCGQLLPNQPNCSKPGVFPKVGD